MGSTLYLPPGTRPSHGTWQQSGPLHLALDGSRTSSSTHPSPPTLFKSPLAHAHNSLYPSLPLSLYLILPFCSHSFLVVFCPCQTYGMLGCYCCYCCALLELESPGSSCLRPAPGHCMAWLGAVAVSWSWKLVYFNNY